MFNPYYSVQQTQFQAPPVLYSQSQPMMVTNQNNMTYQMINLGAGAMMQKMKQRQEEEHIIDMLSKQNELITQLVEDMNWRLDKKVKDMDNEVEELEKQVIIARQKKAEQDYLFKLNRQLNFGLERIQEQELKKIRYPKVIQLGMQVPSIADHEKLEQVYPSSRLKRVQVEEQTQSDYEEFNNPYSPYNAMPNKALTPQYQPQFNSQKRMSQLSTKNQRVSQQSLQSLRRSQQSIKSLKSLHSSQQSQQQQQDQSKIDQFTSPLRPIREQESFKSD